MRNNQRAQSILEYTVVIVCLIAALVAMQIYIKRGISGKLRQSADEIGAQYSPKHTSSNVTTALTSDAASVLYRIPMKLKDGSEGWFSVRKDRINEEVNTRQGYEGVDELSKESLWE